MTEYSRNRYSYNYKENGESNTLTRVQQQYWSTKQAVYRKLGKKEDECIVASDAELDAKLELFRAVEESCTKLMRVLEAYQDKLCAMSHEENALGRFLKENGKQDKTRAGKMMIATGKTLSYTAQQRLALRVPLVRLYQEVETFQYRAITDTSATINKMEKSRTAYRGALMWMKDVSQQLDPDMYKQMEKFKKVQGHVRKTKTKFEKLKVDTLQKVDLLSASRCNMFSHALALYQNTLLQFWEKTAHTMNAVAESFRGYQHYEFSMLKELTEPSKKLAEKTAGQKVDGVTEDEDEIDKDKLIFFEAEYHDEDDATNRSTEKSASLQNLLNSPAKSISPVGKVESNDNTTKAATKNTEETAVPQPPPLVNLEDGKEPEPTPKPAEPAKGERVATKEVNGKCEISDLLTTDPLADMDDSEKDDMTILSEILSAPLGDIPLIPASNMEGSFSQQWQAAFGDHPTSPEKPVGSDQLGFPGSEWDIGNEGSNSHVRPNFFPSQLLEATSAMSGMKLSTQSNDHKVQEDLPTEQQSSAVPQKRLTASTKKSKQQEMSHWFNLFADLDPLANPDSIGKKSSTSDDDHNC